SSALFRGSEARAAVLPPLNESSRRSRLCQLPRGLTARTLAAHASFPEGSFRGGSPRELPCGSGPAFAEAERRLRPSSALFLGSEARAAVLPPLNESSR
ncbi:hypothetical protein M9458_050907, partial [Cirrhinus mrigala]